MPNNLDSAIAAMRREMEQHTESRLTGDWAVRYVTEPYAKIAENALRKLYESPLLEHSLRCTDDGCLQCYKALKARKD